MTKLDHGKAIEKASEIVADNPGLDSLRGDYRQFLINDIARALENTWIDGHWAGYDAGANDQAAKWSAAIDRTGARR